MVRVIHTIERPVVGLAGPLALVLATSVLLSLLEGVPGKLPGVALASEVLLHVERVSATFAIVVAILSVLYEAARGRLPTQLTTGGLAYEPGAHAAGAAAELQTQLDELRAQLEDLAKAALTDEDRRR